MKDWCWAPATGPLLYIRMDPEIEWKDEGSRSMGGAGGECLEASMGPQLESEKAVRIS